MMMCTPGRYTISLKDKVVAIDLCSCEPLLEVVLWCLSPCTIGTYHFQKLQDIIFITLLFNHDKFYFVADASYVTNINRDPSFAKITLIIVLCKNIPNLKNIHISVTTTIWLVSIERHIALFIKSIKIYSWYCTSIYYWHQIFTIDVAVVISVAVFVLNSL